MPLCIQVQTQHLWGMCGPLHQVSYVHLDLKETGWGNEVIASCYVRLENSELPRLGVFNENNNGCYAGCDTDLN